MFSWSKYRLTGNPFILPKTARVKIWWKFHFLNCLETNSIMWKFCWRGFNEWQQQRISSTYSKSSKHFAVLHHSLIINSNAIIVIVIIIIIIIVTIIITIIVIIIIIITIIIIISTIIVTIIAIKPSSLSLSLSSSSSPSSLLSSSSSSSSIQRHTNSISREVSVWQSTHLISVVLISINPF